VVMADAANPSSTPDGSKEPLSQSQEDNKGAKSVSPRGVGPPLGTAATAPKSPKSVTRAAAQVGIDLERRAGGLSTDGLRVCGGLRAGHGAQRHAQQVTTTASWQSGVQSNLMRPW
jgi:hypothetical protein